MTKLTQEQIQANKIEFINLLRSTGREGIEYLINWLETKSDFFEAPSSTVFHGNYAGGLCQHSLNVYKAMKKFIGNSDMLALKEQELDKIPEASIIISTLLHDICKANFYFPEIKNFKDEATNTWKKYQTYKCEDHFPLGHGEKSVIMLQNFGLYLNPNEMLAIRYHMGAWDGAMWTNDLKYAYSTAISMCPLITLIQHADNASSMLFERKVN